MIRAMESNGYSHSLCLSLGEGKPQPPIKNKVIGYYAELVFFFMFYVLGIVLCTLFSLICKCIGGCDMDFYIFGVKIWFFCGMVLQLLCSFESVQTQVNPPLPSPFDLGLSF